jgi:hypothetical protein
MGLIRLGRMREPQFRKSAARLRYAGNGIFPAGAAQRVQFNVSVRQMPLPLPVAVVPEDLHCGIGVAKDLGDTVYVSPMEDGRLPACFRIILAPALHSLALICRSCLDSVQV